MKSKLCRVSAHSTRKRKATIGTNSVAAVCTSALFQLNDRISDGLRGTWLKPNYIGVPTAPNGAGTAFIINVALLKSSKNPLFRSG